MNRLLAGIFTLAMLAVQGVLAQYVPITVDFAEAPLSYELKTSVGNTPTLRVSFKNAGSSITLTNWTPYFKWAKNESAIDGMVTVQGTLSGDYADFVCASNTFARTVKDGYFAVYLNRTNGPQNLTVVRGRLNVLPSPEISQNLALVTTTVVNWDNLTFTGTPPWQDSTNTLDALARSWAQAASNLALSAYANTTNLQVGLNAISPLASNALPRSGGLMTGDINFTNAGLTSLDFAAFDTAPTGAVAAARLQWNSARDTLQLGLNANVNLDVGQQLMLYARNGDTNTIAKGEVVYLNGASGDNPTFKRASNSGESTSSRTIGIAAESITANNIGLIVTRGTVYNLNTTNFAAGALLYLGPNGTMQTNLPTAPLHGVFLGVVERSHQTVGQIYVAVQNYNELKELSDIYVPSPTNLNVLAWISSSNRWESRDAATLVSNGASITNVDAKTLGGYAPGSFVTVSGWNSWSTNVAKQVAVPTNSTAAGAVGNYAATSTGMFVYVENAFGAGTNGWVYFPTFATITTSVSSISNTGSVSGAITFTGVGVTQTGSVFNFSGGGQTDLSYLSNGLINVGLTASNAYPNGGTSGLNWAAISNAPANITTQGTITAASIGAVPNTMTTNAVPLFWNSSVPATTNVFIGFTYGSTLTTRSAGTNYSFAAFVNAATNVYTATASADFSWPLLPTTVTSIELHHACISSTNASLVYEFANTDRGWSYITTQTVANTGLNITTNLTISGTALTNAAPGQLWSVKVTGSGGCTNTVNPAFFGPRTLFKVVGQ